MIQHYLHVSAFTRIAGGGNSAAVVQLAKWPTDERLSELARAIALPVTSVIVHSTEGFELRWLSHSGSFVQSMCGHGTLAASLAVSLAHPNLATFRFITPGGVVSVERKGDEFRLALPRWESFAREPWPELSEALGLDPSEVLDAGRDTLAVFRSENDVRNLRPDMEKLRKLGHRGFIATAPGLNYDCVSRFFCPTFGLGVDEDPVTGSAHCAIAPLWASRLKKQTLRALQASFEQGELTCEVGDSAVTITACAVLRSREEIELYTPTQAP